MELGDFDLGSVLGAGGFGRVVFGTHRQTGLTMAVKIQENHVASAECEALLFQHLAGGVGIPKVYAHGHDGDSHYIVMDLLGPTLKKVYRCCDEIFTTSTVLAIAEQMITCLQFVHSQGVVHRDIKPSNILIGRGDQSAKIYLTDFGVSCIDVDSSGNHLLLEEDGHVGTPAYSSIRAHEGLSQFPRDDLESLGYVLAEFMAYLPWSYLRPTSPEEHQAIAYAKGEFLRDQRVCQQLIGLRFYKSFGVYAETKAFSDPPAEVLSYLRYCRSLGFRQQPDYDYLRCLFMALCFDEGIFAFEWVPEWVDMDTDAMEEPEESEYSWATASDSMP